MFEIFTDLFVVIPAIAIVSGGAALYFATPIKDFFTGIPADLRTALNNVEADAVAKVTAAKKTIVTDAVTSALSAVKVAAPASTAPVVLPAAASAPAAAPAPAAPIAG